MLLHGTPSILLRHTLRIGSLGRALAVAVLVAAGAMACDKVPLTAPAGTVITLVAQTNALPINGSTDLVAVLIENGTTSTGTGTGATTTPSAGTPVHNGTLVTFTTSLGRIEPAEARTTNGRVSVTLVADGRSGIAKITAFSGSASQTLEIKIGAAAAERVLVTAAPSIVPATGGQATISARVEDESGNPLIGVPVSFSTTAGTLSAQSGLTNDSGFATTVLTTTTEATVTANAGSMSSTATIKVRSRSSITLTSPTGAVYVGAPATFVVKPGTAVAFRNVFIEFGDGESWDLGAISSDTTVVHYYTSDGLFQATVTGTDVDGGAAEARGSVGVAPISFAVSSTPTTAAKNELFVFAVTGLPASVPIDRFVWSFGDGGAQTTSVASTTHAYTTAGIKTVTVTVYPLYGGSKAATFQVLVTETS